MTLLTTILLAAFMVIVLIPMVIFVCLAKKRKKSTEGFDENQPPSMQVHQESKTSVENPGQVMQGKGKTQNTNFVYRKGEFLPISKVDSFPRSKLSEAKIFEVRKPTKTNEKIAHRTKTEDGQYQQSKSPLGKRPPKIVRYRKVKRLVKRKAKIDTRLLEYSAPLIINKEDKELISLFKDGPPVDSPVPPLNVLYSPPSKLVNS